MKIFIGSLYFARNGATEKALTPAGRHDLIRLVLSTTKEWRREPHTFHPTGWAHLLREE